MPAKSTNRPKPRKVTARIGTGSDRRLIAAREEFRRLRKLAGFGSMGRK